MIQFQLLNGQIERVLIKLLYSQKTELEALKEAIIEMQREVIKIESHSH